MKTSAPDLPPSEVLYDAPASVGPPTQTDGGSPLSGKRCSKCGAVKPASAFAINKLAKSGLASRCKDCNAPYFAAYNQKRLESKRIYMRSYSRKNAKRIARQKREHRLKYPDKNKAKCKKWAAENVALKRAGDRAWYAANAARCHAMNKAWRAAHPELDRAFAHKRRARKRGAAGATYTTAAHIASRWEMFGGRCWVCGCPAEATDHMIALAKGGTHWPANLRPICNHHNSTKHARPYREFLALRPAQTPLPLP
jgi:hypothetical protein